MGVLILQKLKLSASNMPVPDEYHYHEPGKQPTTVLLFPSFTIIDQVTPALTPDLIKYFVNPAATTTTPLTAPRPESTEETVSEASSEAGEGSQQSPHQQQLEMKKTDIKSLTPLRSRPCPHSAVILLCSQRTRDVRCGQSAPLLRREFERHLRPLGLYRELDDERPGGVGIYFVSHVGGHKYAANVIVYRRRDFNNWYCKPAAAASVVDNDDDDGESSDQEEGKTEEGASQGIWLARVRPEDCENIIRYTVLQGKVVKPGHQLRGGFDREKGLISW